MKKVWIVPGCISCGTCEQVCPQVFEVRDIAYVKDNAPLDTHEDEICEAAEICPVNVIKYEK
jgi:ferredoxin